MPIFHPHLPVRVRSCASAFLCSAALSSISVKKLVFEESSLKKSALDFGIFHPLLKRSRLCGAWKARDVRCAQGMHQGGGGALPTARQVVALTCSQPYDGRDDLVISCWHGDVGGCAERSSCTGFWLSQRDLHQRLPVIALIPCTASAGRSIQRTRFTLHVLCMPSARAMAFRRGSAGGRGAARPADPSAVRGRDGTLIVKIQEPQPVVSAYLPSINSLKTTTAAKRCCARSPERSSIVVVSTC